MPLSSRCAFFTTQSPTGTPTPVVPVVRPVVVFASSTTDRASRIRKMIHRSGQRGMLELDLIMVCVKFI